MLLQVAWNVICARPITARVAAAMGTLEAKASAIVPAEASRPAVTGSAIGGRR